MNDILKVFIDDELCWMPNAGIGYYPVTARPYDADYFMKYQAMESTEIGKKLNKARIDLVNKYTQDKVLDIGIGSGIFLSERPDTFGFDINPVAVNWLIERKRYLHPLRGSNSVTFWDSLEHIHNPTMILQGAKEYVFISCPIYKDFNHLMSSKHLRYDEHCWYWTYDGLIRFMGYFCFDLIESNDMETQIGREDILTFVFKRSNYEN